MPSDEPGDVGGAGARCVHDDVDVQPAPVGQNECPNGPVGTGADVTDRSAESVLGAGCDGQADQAADEMSSVHPGFVGIEHDRNLVGQGESRFEAAAYLGPRVHLDPVVGVPVRMLSPILLAYSVPSGADGSLVGTAAAVWAFPVAGGVWNVDAAEAVAEGA